MLTLQKVKILKGHTDTVRALSWGLVDEGTATLLASASSDQTIRLWDPEGMYRLRTIIYTTSYNVCVHLHPTGHVSARTGEKRNRLSVWNRGGGVVHDDFNLAPEAQIAHVCHIAGNNHFSVITLSTPSIGSTIDRH